MGLKTTQINWLAPHSYSALDKAIATALKAKAEQTASPVPMLQAIARDTERRCPCGSVSKHKPKLNPKLTVSTQQKSTKYPADPKSVGAMKLNLRIKVPSPKIIGRTNPKVAWIDQ